MLIGAAGFSALGKAAEPALAGVFEVTRYGAAGDGKKLDTTSIQQAVDACGKAGGGIVYFGNGVYRSGTIHLRDGVKLHLSEGARLLGSTDLKDYPSNVPQLRSYTDSYTDKSLIYAERASGVGIEGDGIIDGQGASFQGAYKVRPYLMRFVECRDVTVRDIHLHDSPMWVEHYLGCEGVRITGVSVHSRVNKNNDGIDIDSCSGVRISDCDIVSGDDAIVLKATADRPCRDVVVTNCVLSTLCNALKLGTESNGGFENIAFNNCTVYDTRLAGVALEMVDGGTLSQVVVTGITMRNVKCPLFIRLGNRARPIEPNGPRPGMGALRDVVIQGIEASGGSLVGSSITGLPGHRAQNITLRDVSLSFQGGGTAQDADRVVPENPECYPEHSMFGTLPAFGLYCRHLEGLQLDNVRCVTEKPDARKPMIFDDVEDLVINGRVAKA
ncbi:MAG TPA: glycoside hydrolase family 28 protein [Bryobacteraceae bacterium]|nr:glycoside hydrolase family 28 protein [Bryobacteraceae bacterium]